MKSGRSWRYGRVALHGLFAIAGTAIAPGIGTVLGATFGEGLASVLLSDRVSEVIGGAIQEVVGGAATDKLLGYEKEVRANEESKLNADLARALALALADSIEKAQGADPDWKAAWAKFLRETAKDGEKAQGLFEVAGSSKEWELTLVEALRYPDRQEEIVWKPIKKQLIEAGRQAGLSPSYSETFLSSEDFRKSALGSLRRTFAKALVDSPRARHKFNYYAELDDRAPAIANMLDDAAEAKLTDAMVDALTTGQVSEALLQHLRPLIERLSHELDRFAEANEDHRRLIEEGRRHLEQEREERDRQAKRQEQVATRMERAVDSFESRTPFEDLKPLLLSALDDLRRIEAPATARKVELEPIVAHLANGVREQWILSFLNPALKSDDRQPLPIRFRRYSSQGVEQEPMPAKSIFNDCAGRFVISGPKGSGKTIFMLRRVEELLNELEQGDSKLIPVPINANSWYDARRALTDQDSFEEWFVKQTAIQFGLAKKNVENLISTKKIIFCIDGIDQVGKGYHVDGALGGEDDIAAKDVRRAFLDRLSEFDAAGSHRVSIIATSDSEQSSDLLTSVGCSVVIEPVTEEEVVEWLQSSGAVALLDFLQAHPSLFERVRSDLFGLQQIEKMLHKQGGPTLEDRLRKGDEDGFISDCYDSHYVDLFDATYPASTSPKFSYDRLHAYLANLAVYLSGRGPSTMLRLDELSPRDLGPDLIRSYRKWLALTVFAEIFLFSALSPMVGVYYGWAAHGQPAMGVRNGLLTAMFIGVVGGGLAALSYAYIPSLGKARFLKWTFDKALLYRALGIGLGFGFGRGATVTFAVKVQGVRAGLFDGALQGAAGFVLASIIFFIFFVHMDDDSLEIKLMEKHKLDVRRWGLAAGVALLVALGVAFIGTETHLVDGAAFGLSILILLGVFLGRQHETKPYRVRPNQGIRHAFRMAFGWSTFTAISCSIVFYVTYRYGHGSPEKGTEAAIEALSFMVTFFFLDGLTVVKYIALRATLRVRRNYLPIRLEVLLKMAAKIGMVRQLGGGFVFANESVFRYLRTESKILDHSDWQRK